MSKLFGVIMLAIGSMLSTAACAESFNPETTIIIKGPIAGQTMGPITEKLDELLMYDQAPKAVTLILDSPGGSVYAGFRFIAQMKSLQGKGTKFVCYVPGLAASMAFHILTHCDTRTVLQESALLWHRARIFMMFSVMTAPASSAIARDLQSIDEHILKDVSAALKRDMSNEDIVYHFEHETLHIGQRLCNSAPNFCVAKSHVPGLMEALNNPAITISVQPQSIEDRKTNMFTGLESIVYVYTKYLTSLVTGR